MGKLLKPLFIIIIVIGVLIFLLASQQPGSAEIGLPAAKPEEMGFSSEKLAEAHQHVRKYVDENKIAGFITLVARKGKIVHLEKYGMRDIEQQRPMEYNTIFRLASMTKPVSSVALMILYEQGKVKLDDPVKKYIPEFAETKVYTGNGNLIAQQRPMTVKDALVHTTGLTAGEFGNGPVHKLYQESGIGEATDLADFVKRLAKLPLLHQPGAAWTYGFSTDLVARIVEIVSQMPFDEFMKKNILEPLKMKDTAYQTPENKLDRFASAYTARGGSGLQFVNAPVKAEFPRGISRLYSTTEDYLRFARMMLNGGALEGVRILRPETVALMTRNHLPENLIPIGVLGLSMPNNGFGLGFSVVVDDENAPPLPNGFWWNRGAPPIGSYWWIGSYQTYFWIDPENEIIGMLMTQSIDMPYPYKQEFHKMVYEAFRGGVVSSGP